MRCRTSCPYNTLALGVFKGSEGDWENNFFLVKVCKIGTHFSAYLCGSKRTRWSARRTRLDNWIIFLRNVDVVTVGLALPSSQTRRSSNARLLCIRKESKNFFNYETSNQFIYYETSNIKSVTFLQKDHPPWRLTKFWDIETCLSYKMREKNWPKSIFRSSFRSSFEHVISCASKYSRYHEYA